MLDTVHHTQIIYLSQGKTTDNAGKDGGKKKSKGAGDAGGRTEVSDPGSNSLFRSSLLFFSNISLQRV